MENTAIEMMRNYVKSQEFDSTSKIMEAMKDMFRDALMGKDYSASSWNPLR